MRLYALIPNELYLNKIHQNKNKLGRIFATDLFGTPHGMFLPMLMPFLQIWGKEDYFNNAIIMFTTPAEMKKYIIDDFIGISVETNDKLFCINADNFMYFIENSFKENKDIFQREQNLENFEEFVGNVSIKAENFQKDIAKVDNFYDAFGVIQEININDIKNIYYSPNCKILNNIKEDKQNKLFNYVIAEDKEEEQ